MAKRMLIDATHSEETRVAVLNGTRLEAFDFETSTKKQIKGNIYLAKVTRVEPSLQAAFVDYGGNRHGFLAFSEIHPDYYRIPVGDRQAIVREQRAAHSREDSDVETLYGELDDPDRVERPERAESPRHAFESDEADDGDEAGESAFHEHEDVAGDEDGDDRHREAEPADHRASADSDAHDDADHLGLPPSVTASPGEHLEGDLTEEQVTEFVDATPHAIVTGDATSVDDRSADSHASHLPEADHHEPVVSHSYQDGEAEDDATPPTTAHDSGVPPADAAFAAELADQADEVMLAAEAEAGWQGEEPDHEEPDQDDVPDHEDAYAAEGFAGDDEDQIVETVGGDELEVEEVTRTRHRPLRSYKIQEVIKRRQILLVQVTKEERGNKGAALTTYLSLAGRYCVLMPNTDRGGGVSRKITSVADRRRLKDVVSELDVPEGIGIIVRTAGSERSQMEIKRDYEYLLRLWDDIRELTLSSQAPALIHEESSLIKRAIRDLYTKEIGEILVDGEDGYRTAKDFMRMLIPGQARQVQAYRDPAVPLFHRFQVDSQIDAIHSPIAQLKSGGYIVINTTEALVAIDVNSGRSTKERNIEETATKTNLEAADEVARQLRLRDLAGLVVIDFIDMEDGRNRASVERRLKEAMRVDRARIQLGRISPFGLLELSRQRLRPSILEASTQPCPHCNGTGTIRSTESTALVVLRAIEEEGIRLRSAEISVAIPTSVALYMLNHKRQTLSEIEDRYQFTVTVVCDDELIPPAFRIERLSALTAEQAAAPRALLPRSGRATPVFEEEEDEPEIDVEPPVQAEAPEPQGEEKPTFERRPRAEGEDDGTRRRRRRRRSRRPDGLGAEAMSEAGPEASEFAGADDEDTEDAAVVAPPETGDIAPAAGEILANGAVETTGDEEDGGARRRRGRRGGRRRARREDEAPVGDMPADDLLVGGFGPVTDFANDGRPFLDIPVVEDGGETPHAALAREEPSQPGVQPLAEDIQQSVETPLMDTAMTVLQPPAPTDRAVGHTEPEPAPVTESVSAAAEPAVLQPLSHEPPPAVPATTIDPETPAIATSAEPIVTPAAKPAVVPHMVTTPPANPRSGWWKRLLP